MRRLDSVPAPDLALMTFARLQRDGAGLALLRARMPAGATLEDARRLREKIFQTRRAPCGCLDRPLGITRG